MPPLKRGAPVGHPPYRPAVLTARMQVYLTPELKSRTEAAAKACRMSVSAWCAEALEISLAGIEPEKERQDDEKRTGA